MPFLDKPSSASQVFSAFTIYSKLLINLDKFRATVCNLYLAMKLLPSILNQKKCLHTQYFAVFSPLKPICQRISTPLTNFVLFECRMLFSLLLLLISALRYSYCTTAFTYSLLLNFAITLCNLKPLWTTAC